MIAPRDGPGYDTNSLVSASWSTYTVVSASMVDSINREVGDFGKHTKPST